MDIKGEIDAYLKRNPDLKPIVFTEGYDVTFLGVEKIHSFDSTKYSKIFKRLLDEHRILKNKREAYEPSFPSMKFVYDVMSASYLLKQNYSIYLTKYIEMPLFAIPGCLLRSVLLDSMLMAAKGSVDAAFLSLRKGWAINLSGGYHHADLTNGGGFCVYPDITLISHYIRK